MAESKFGTWFKAKMKLYFIDAMGAMALGLFATLLIGTIFGTLAKIPYLGFFNTIAGYAQGATGMAIGVAMAYKMKCSPLTIFSSAVVGSMGYSLGAVLLDGKIIEWAATGKGAELGSIFCSGGPAGAFFAVIIACEVGKLVAGKTKVDILVTPSVTILSGFAASWALCPLIAYAMYYIGVFVNTATEYQPILMGIVLAVVVGVILTLPISSAAICAMIGISGIAGGAAAVGCCAQMVGFAVMSFRENKWGGLVSQGLGTSMLQMPNIIKNPRIWIPPILASAIIGPLATTVFKLECNGVAAGMGTCGLVGPIGIYNAMGGGTMMWVGMIVLCVILPAVLSIVFCEILRKIGWIKENDLLLKD